MAIQLEYYPEEVKKQIKKKIGDKTDEFIAKFPSFNSEYQTWYSEAQIVIKQLLPERLQDFTRYYEKPKGRKELSLENYRIEDCLQGLNATRGYDKIKVVGPEAAISLFRQQLAILNSVKSRFESSLFDIRQLVQADLFDSEILMPQQNYLKRDF